MAPVRAWQRPFLLIALAAAILPFVVTGVRAGLDHWVPTGDNAILATRAGDVFSASSPSLGMTTSVESYRPGLRADHPGPLLFWALAVPYALSGHSSVGILVGLVLLQVAAVVTVALVALRWANATLAMLLLSGITILAWSLHGPTLAFPVNPIVMILPFLAFCCLCWALACGDGWALPIAIAVGSLCAQSHVSYAPAALALGGCGLVGYLLARRSSANKVSRPDQPSAPTTRPSATRNRGTPDAGSRRRPGRNPAARPLVLVSLATAGVCWGPPLYQQLFSRHGNLTALLDWASPGSDTGRPAAGFAWQAVRVMVGVRPLFADGNPGSPVAVHTATGWSAALVLAVLAAALVWARLHGSRSMLWLLIVTAVGVVAGAATAVLSGTTIDPQSFRALWALGLVAWAAGLAVLLQVVRRAVPVLGRPRVVLPVLAILSLLATAAALLGSDPTGRRGDRSVVASQEAVRALTPQILQATGGRGTYAIASVGAESYLSNGPGLLRNLEQHGLSIRTPDDRFAYGSRRASRAGIDGTLLVVDRRGQAGWQVPSGARVVARYETPDAGPVEREALRRLARLPRLDLTPAGRTFVRQQLEAVRSDPRAEAALRRIFSVPPTAPVDLAAAEAAFARPARLLAVLGPAMVESGALRRLILAGLIKAPPELLPVLARFDSLDAQSRNATTVYLVRSGPTS